MNIILIILSILFVTVFIFNFLKPDKQIIFNTISRVFVGIIFVFSGFVKAVDPMGSTIKFTDYFNAFGLESFVDIVFPLAILLSGIEFLIGISLLLNLKIKFGSILALLFMMFFTPLTLYLAIANPVTDCGCFGDALIITNWQTFWKNLVILLPTIIVFVNKKNIESFLSVANQNLIIVLFAVAITWFSVYCDQHLPVLDFRPYKIGNNISALQKEIFELDENIPAEKAILDKIPESERYDSVITKFIYVKDGIKKEFTDVPEDTTWQWVETINDIIKEGYHPPIHDFSISNTDGEDITSSVLNDSSYSFLIISYKLDKADFNGIINATKLASKYKNNYKFYFLTASLKEDVIMVKDSLLSIFADDTLLIQTSESSIETIYYYEKDGDIQEFTADNLPDDTWQYIDEEEIVSDNEISKVVLPFDFYTTDETTLKTIIRSNPALVLIKNGTIINKWAYRDIPTEIDL